MQPVQLDLAKLPSANSDYSVTRLKGRLSLETVHNFIETMRAEPANHLVLEMNEVSFMDSAGVGALVSLFVTRRNSGKTLALAALTPKTAAVLQVAGLVRLLPTYPTVEEALAQK